MTAASRPPGSGRCTDGDAVAPRLLSEATSIGHRLAREIDSPDPAVPLPYRREPPG